MTVFERIPSVDRVLAFPDVEVFIQVYGRAVVSTTVREVLARIRQSGQNIESSVGEKQLCDAVREELASKSRTSLRSVFNLTGTVLHTNLGRTLLPRESIDAIATAMEWPVTLEFDLRTGSRGDRDNIVEGLICELTGAEAATVVNNNAAAVLLLLNTLAAKREVVVSRGELVEIGGAFRVPDVMSRAGAKLVEVGTTNRTHPSDYENAITKRTALLMKVHCSNYAITGFTTSVSESRISTIAHAAGLPCAVDLGSGTLIDLTQYDLPKEPTVREIVGHGADLVTFSGDKLLGGPQAGIVVGRKELIQRIKKNPLKRALRVGKLTLAALEALLFLYRDPVRIRERIPTLRLLTRSQSEIIAQANRIAPAVSIALSNTATVEVRAMQSQIGSGALPVDSLPSAGLVIKPLRESGTALRKLEEAFRSLPIPVIGFVREKAYQLDLRCLQDESSFVSQLSALSNSA